jgi:hypothetical protein
LSDLLLVHAEDAEDLLGRQQRQVGEGTEGAVADQDVARGQVGVDLADAR